jgi:16S rRNA (adenine1518-N6/adenine1519-N6)-dimethyltransferase
MSDLPDQAWLKAHPREVLREHGLWASKYRGQNFLVSSSAMERIVKSAGIGSDEVVLEVGTGLGRLTARLAAEAVHVVSIEVDEVLHGIARRNLADFPNVTLLLCDFLESKHRIQPAVTEAVRQALRETERALKVVSNLPYGISSPAVVNLLEWELEPKEMYLTLQREVADRMTADPGTGDYGPLTVFVRYWAEAEVLFNLGSADFWPAPDVTSSFIHLSRSREVGRAGDYDRFAGTVRELFTFRRKTVRKALRLAFGAEQARRALERSGVDGGKRVEGLSVADFQAIARASGSPGSGGAAQK